ncbi:hypothetical protein E1211_17345 [Micromonospora sp. 15K316]|nr:hypothetical protein E1211_17345 [Micromonospora sp. 15K316]
MRFTCGQPAQHRRKFVTPCGRSGAVPTPSRPADGGVRRPAGARRPAPTGRAQIPRPRRCRVRRTASARTTRPATASAR